MMNQVSKVERIVDDSDMGGGGVLLIVSKLVMRCCGANGQVGGMRMVEMGMKEEVGFEWG